MSTHTAESPLDVLRSELESTSRQAQLALESYLQNSDDKAALTSVADLFKQIHGALVMLEQEDIAAVAEEIVILVNALRRNDVVASESIEDVLLRAVLQMPQYLEWLHHGWGQHLNVAPLLRQLRTAGVGSAPSTDAVPAPADRCNLRELASRLRPMLQRALVGILRAHNPADNLNRVKGIFAQFKETAPDEPAYRFWWIAESLVDELRSGGIAPSHDISFLLRDLDNHVKLLNETGVGSYDDAAQKNLSQRIIERLSSSATGAKRIDERINYHPPNTFSESMPAEIEAIAPPDVETLLQIATYLKQDLILITDAVDRFERSGSSDAGKLRGELDRLHQVANVLLLLNIDVSAGIVERWLTTLERQAASGEKVTGEQLFALATELILVEDSFDSVGDFAIRNELSTPVNSADQVRLLRGVQLKRACLLATHEAVALMKEARERVTAYIESGSDREVWLDLQPALRKVGGTLALLDCDQAAALVRRLEGVVPSLAADRGGQQHEIFNVFCEVLVTVEYYLYSIAAARKSDEGILDHAATQLRLLGERLLASPRAASVEATPETRLEGEFSRIQKIGSEKLDSRSNLGGLGEGPFLPVGKSEDAGETRTAKGSVIEAKEATSGRVEDIPAEPVPAGVDPDLMELFTVEAAEILDSSDTILQKWGADRKDDNLLNELRREMHTLKGSARMAGFMAVGNMAHTIESLLDAVARGEVPVSAGVVDVLQRSLDSLNAMFARVQTGVQAEPPEHLIQQLHVLLDTGEAMMEPETAAAAEAEEVPVEEAAAIRAEPVPDQISLDAFLAEAAEVLNVSDAALRRWSMDPENINLLNELRREMHTLKGSARTAGLVAMGNMAQATESLLDAMTTGSIKLSPVILDALQRAQDALSMIVIQAQSGEKVRASEDLINDLNDLAGIGEKPAKTRPRITAYPKTTAKLTEDVAPAAEETIRVSAALLNGLVNQMGESSIYRARIDQKVGALGFNLHELDQTVARLRELLRRLDIETETQILFRYEGDVTDYHEDFDPLELDRFSELQQLSRALMETVDDLVNIKHTLEDQSQDIGFLLDQQGKINKEIQRGLMQTRMVRFNTIIPRLRRVVRQACQELGKHAELVLEGSESEVDRGVLENMVAPLEHLLRNSVTHGIETPQQRRQVGKPETGAITLALRREGAELVLTVRDDGSGFAFDAIQAKGQSLGFLESHQPATEQELIALLLRPGFSTANRVTQLAGRGVGLDVVNDAVKAMHGALNIQSQRGKGVEFTIRLPFSLAVTQALLVQAGSEVYAVPLLSLEAVTRLDGGQLKAYLAGEAVTLEYDRHHYPLHSLGVVFAGDAPQGAAIEGCAPALLFRSAESTAALQVDAVLGSQEIIVKPVVPQLHLVPGISGATILGDGRVVLVLELAALVRSLAGRIEKPAEMIKLRMTQQQAEGEHISTLVVDDSITVRKVTARFLERHNFQVTTAKDGLDAIALLEKKLPDLIIMDIEMPRMDGFEVLAAIQNQPRWRHLPVIMVTSRGGEKHRERAKNLGVNDYLVKPYQEEELMTCIRKALDGRSLRIPA